MSLDDFTDATLRRCRVARAHNDGHPLPGWSTREQLAVALVLEDKAHLEAMRYTVQEAAQSVHDGMLSPPAAFGAWIESIRIRLDAPEVPDAD
jgi:hypothetical protein